MKKLAVLFLMAWVPFRAAYAVEECRLYEPGIVFLKGTVQRNPAQNIGGKNDEEAGRLSPWVLQLDQPICVEGKDDDKAGMYPLERNVTNLVLALRKSDAPARYDAFEGKHVLVTGTLFHQLPASTTRQIVIMVSDIDANEKNWQYKQ